MLSGRETKVSCRQWLRGRGRHNWTQEPRRCSRDTSGLKALSMTPSWGGRTGANYTRSHRRGRLCPNRSQRRRSGARRPRNSQRDAGATSACGSQLSYSLC